MEKNLTAPWQVNGQKLLYMYAMKYHSDIFKKESLSSAKAQMDLEGIMLREISQRKTNDFIYVRDLKKVDHVERVELWLPRVVGGKYRDVGQRYKFSVTINS